MLAQSVTSGTVVALSMGELMSVIITLIGLVGGVIAFVRKDERDKARIDLGEKSTSELVKIQTEDRRQIGDLREQVLTLTLRLGGLTEQVTRLVDTVSSLLARPPATTRQPQKRQPTKN